MNSDYDDAADSYDFIKDMLDDSDWDRYSKDEEEELTPVAVTREMRELAKTSPAMQEAIANIEAAQRAVDDAVEKAKVIYELAKPTPPAPKKKSPSQKPYFKKITVNLDDLRSTWAKDAFTITNEDGSTESYDSFLDALKRYNGY